MQVFGVCKAYNYITHLRTYAPTPPTRSQANHRLLFFFFGGGLCVRVTVYTAARDLTRCGNVWSD